MECAAKGRGIRCVGPPLRICARCKAVAYCSLSLQISHWNDHREECERLEEQMGNVDIVNEFPFTFREEATTQICEKKGSRCTFLARRNLHQIGMWSHECSCRSLDVRDNLSVLMKCWNLSSMEPFKHVNLLFLHHDWLFTCALLNRDGERINLDTFACCADGDCKCKMPNETRSSPVTLQLLKGFYHDRFKDIVKDGFPHLIVAPNAGIAAYPSWKETIELIHLLNIPAVFTDFCKEAAHLAASCLSSITGCELALPIKLNPFRQPLAVEDSVLHLPCYSNCFMFGI